MLTIRDVARAAHVAPSTVSLALRGHSKISPVTIRRVKEAARKIGYKVNPLLSLAMSGYRTKAPGLGMNIAYLTALPPSRDQEFPAFVDLRKGLVDRAQEYELPVDLFAKQELFLNPRAFVRTLVARNVRGMILGPGTSELNISQLPWKEIFFVAIGHTAAPRSVPRVLPDTVKIVRMAFNHALAAGYCRIGLVISKALDRAAEGLWTAGYWASQALAEFKQAAPICYWENGDSEKKLLKWLRENEIEVALIRDLAVANALRRQGVEIPAECRVSYLARTSRTEKFWSGPNLNTWQVGAQAVDLLIHQIRSHGKGSPISPVDCLLAPFWEEGSSLPPKSGRPN